MVGFKARGSRLITGNQSGQNGLVLFGNDMREDPFVEEAQRAGARSLKPPLLIRRGVSLLYQVAVNNRLELVVDPKKPVRGRSAFQTDLCVFEAISDETEIPRVVMEFKKGVSTHDVLTYSTKARKHKQVYPYLRYGLVIGSGETVPGRFFTHNEALDFCVAAALFRNRVGELFASLLEKEIAASRRLERIIFGEELIHVFREEVVIESDGAKAS